MSIRRFRIEAPLWSGASLYRAIQTIGGEEDTVLLRLITGEDGPARASRLARRGLQTRLTGHPGINPVDGVTRIDGHLTVVSAMPPGSSLLDHQAAAPTAAAALELVGRVADALGAAHAIGLSHGSLDERMIYLSAEGRPVLHGFTAVETPTDPADDITGLGRLLARLLPDATGTAAELIVWMKSSPAPDAPSVCAQCRECVGDSGAAELGVWARSRPPGEPTTDARVGAVLQDDDPPAIVRASGALPASPVPRQTRPASEIAENPVTPPRPAWGAPLITGLVVGWFTALVIWFFLG